jgi:hypothetical protein
MPDWSRVSATKCLLGFFPGRISKQQFLFSRPVHVMFMKQFEQTEYFSKIAYPVFLEFSQVL